MGQIVGLKAKPKRCNRNALGSVPTPAAGEHILVSYDNSMTANGQGNFDRYIIGDGVTAATALELKYLDDSTHPYIVEEVNKAVADIQPIEITGDVTNAPDEEDLTSENQGGTDVLKFKDKAYNSALYSGLGRTYLRKNIVNGFNVLTQAMVNTANTIYHIQYDYDLNGQTITIPPSSYLQFDGGRLKNGIVRGNFANTEFNVKDFGAVGDGATDDTNAIKNALASIAYSTTNTRYILYFPKGEYLITESNVFASFSATNVRSMLVRGDSQFTSRLILVTNGSEKWFYDNESVSAVLNDRRKLMRLEFENIGFNCDDPLYANGFKVWSNGHDKQFRFVSCTAVIGTFFKATGSANADLTIIDRCNISALYLLETNNSQSVAHRITNTNLSLVYGAVKNTSGGNIWFSNCSIEMRKTISIPAYGRFSIDGYDAVTTITIYNTASPPYYLVESSGESGFGNSGICFALCRFELHDSSAFAKISDHAKLTFIDCCLAVITSGIIASSITNTASLTLIRCAINPNVTFGVGGGSTVGRITPSLFLYNCDLNRNDPTTIYQLDDTLSKVKAVDCYNAASGDSAENRLMDIDYGLTMNNGSDGYTANVKVVGALSNYTSGVESGSRNDTWLRLPSINIFTGFAIHIAAMAGSGQSTKIQVIGTTPNNEEITLFQTIDALPMNEEFTFKFDCFYVNKFTKITFKKISNVKMEKMTFVGFYI